MSSKLPDYMKNAIYVCRKCHYRWTQRVDRVTCPKCGHIYVDWINHPLNLSEASQ